jgi:hypothetical protein
MFSACLCRLDLRACPQAAWQKRPASLPTLLHFTLIGVRREGRSMIYAARYETMNDLLAYLTENCCQGAPCGPEAACKPARAKRAKVLA